MPEEENQGMTQITFSVPTPLLHQAKEIATYDGWRMSELFRLLWVQGLTFYAEGSNKRLVNKGLREKN